VRRPPGSSRAVAPGGNILASGEELQPAGVGELGDELFVGICIRATELVMKVEDQQPDS